MSCICTFSRLDHLFTYTNAQYASARITARMAVSGTHKSALIFSSTTRGRTPTSVSSPATIPTGTMETILASLPSSIWLTCRILDSTSTMAMTVLPSRSSRRARRKIRSTTTHSWSYVFKRMELVTSSTIPSSATGTKNAVIAATNNTKNMNSTWISSWVRSVLRKSLLPRMSRVRWRRCFVNI